MTNNPAFDERPAWSPDGSKIAFDSNRTGPSDFEVYVMNADGTGQTRLTNNAAVDGHPSWSPDGTKIAFHTNRDGNSEIYAMNPDGSSPMNLSNFAGASEEWPAWSPDGTKIAFQTNRDGNVEVYVMNANGSAPTNLSTNPSDGDGSPDWQPAFYDFDGFFWPVDNDDTFNIVKARRAIPVKFSLNGDQGLYVFAPGFPKSRDINCDPTAPMDGIEVSTEAAGKSGLSYDAAADQYTYVWKTDKGWAGTCRQLVVKLDDGTAHRASFEFK